MATRRPRARTRRPTRRFARRILVVTEGKLTEPQYVEGLNRHLRTSGTTTVVKTVPVGKDPVRVVRKCIDLRDQANIADKPYDVCVCLVDVDDHETLSTACRVADRESVVLLVSNLKFEVWLRWHAEDACSAMSSTQLDEAMAKLGLVTKKVLSPTFPFDSVHRACEIARRADPHLRAGRAGPDPSSALPILIDLMLGR